MKNKREIRDYLNDILENINKIIKFVSNISYEEFVKNDEKVYAVIRAIEIIGEATKNIPQNFRKKYLEIPSLKNKIEKVIKDLNMEG